ncbi:MAG: LarC family nickel insertion protein, partial [Candidatus Aminicenantia bacterium]
MATIYLDCSSGICGNMLLGALLDLGYSKDDFLKKIKETKLPVEIEIKRAKRNSIDSILVEVNVLKKSPARRKKDVFKVIDSLPFSSAVRDKSREVFERLFSAEAKVHGLDKNKAHLHEAGANDAIVDVVGSLFLLEELGIKRVFSSPVNVGGGFVESSHGKLPVPAPATAELLKNVPVYLQGNSELVTPTGAALLVSITEQFTPHLNFIFEKIGYGAGSRDSDDLPNVLRIFYGKIEDNNLEKIIDIE